MSDFPQSNIPCMDGLTPYPSNWYALSTGWPICVHAVGLYAQKSNWTWSKFILLLSENIIYSHFCLTFEKNVDAPSDT